LDDPSFLSPIIVNLINWFILLDNKFNELHYNTIH